MMQLTEGVLIGQLLQHLGQLWSEGLEREKHVFTCGVPAARKSFCIDEAQLHP